MYISLLLKAVLQNNPHANILIGFAIGGEGIFSALIPLWVGVVSDRIWTKRWGRRKPFMIFAGPFMAAALILAPFQPSYAAIAVSTFAFFAAYQFYTSPYQSLLPDVTPADSHGRVQGIQSFMRGGGMFMGMVVAGPLFYWTPVAPFVLCGMLLIVFTFITASKVIEPEPDRTKIPPRVGLVEEGRRIWRSLRAYPNIQRFMVATFLWESTLAGLRAFIMLYFVYTLHTNTSIGGLLLVMVGVTYMVAGVASGYMADRYGRSRIMRYGLWIYLGGCVFGFFARDIRWLFIVLPIFGLGGSIVLTLPYAILIRLMPREHIGQFTGMFSMMRGLANIFAPLIAGAAVDAVRPHVQPGAEYAVIWVVPAVMIVLSLFFFRGGGQDEVLNV
jgi:MFS family permease